MSQGTNRGLLPDGFGHYFAGIADGEGHFGIIKATKRGNTTYQCCFVIVMRDDDRPFLEEMQDTTGLGSLYTQAERQKIGHRSKPQVIWRVHGKRDCLALVELFEQFPLRTRKARDYGVWAKAVRYLNGPRPEGWRPMERWFAQIRAIREYVDREVELDDELEALALFGLEDDE